MSEDQGRDAEFEKSASLREAYKKAAGSIFPAHTGVADRLQTITKGPFPGEGTFPGEGLLPGVAELVARAFDGLLDGDARLTGTIKQHRGDLARQAGQSIERIIKASGSTKGEVKELTGTGKDRFADIVKGRIGTKNKPLDIVLISDLCTILDVPPSVLLGDLDEEEFEVIRRLRGMGEEQRAAVMCIIKSMPEGD